MEEVEVRNIAAASMKIGEDQCNNLEYINPYLYFIQIFNIQTFNARIMKIKVIPTCISDEPLSEDRLLPPKTFLLSNRHSNTSPEDLSEVWNISVQQAKMTLEATTQHNSRLVIMPLSRRYCMDRMFEPVRLRSQMSTDTMDPRCEGLHGDQQCQVFGNKEMFAAAYPIKSKRGDDVDQDLKQFISDYGAP